MTSTQPPLSSAGSVKPWIQKFTNTPRDAFFDQFADSHDAKFVEIIEGPVCKTKSLLMYDFNALLAA